MKGYSKSALYAINLLSSQIRQARLQQKISIKRMSERLGVSSVTYGSLEKGALTIAIGTYLEAMALLDLPFYQMSEKELRLSAEKAELQLALLPKRIAPPKNRTFDDNF